MGVTQREVQSVGFVAREREVLSGDLSDVGLATLLQVVQMEGLSGWIRVRGRGAITLVKGQVVGAECGELRGSDALLELLFADHGRFEVVQGSPAAAPPLPGVTFAVMDAYRLRDEWERLGGLVLRRIGGTQWRPTGAAIDAVMAEIDGVRSLRSLVAGLGVSPTQIIDAARDAIDIGLIEAAAVVQAPEVHGDLHELLDQSREAMRRGDLVGAIRLLEQALLVDPSSRVAQQNLRRLCQLHALSV